MAAANTMLMSPRLGDHDFEDNPFAGQRHADVRDDDDDGDDDEDEDDDGAAYDEGYTRRIQEVDPYESNERKSANAAQRLTLRQALLDSELAGPPRAPSPRKKVSFSAGSAQNSPRQVGGGFRDENHSLLFVGAAGTVLNAVSGTINGICLASVFNETTTHISGSAVVMGRELTSGLYAGAAGFQLLKMICFLSGAIASGGYLGSEHFRGGHRYAHILMMVGICLFAAAISQHFDLVVTSTLVVGLAQGFKTQWLRAMAGQ